MKYITYEIIHDKKLSKEQKFFLNILDPKFDNEELMENVSWQDKRIENLTVTLTITVSENLKEHSELLLSEYLLRFGGEFRQVSK